LFDSPQPLRKTAKHNKMSSTTITTITHNDDGTTTTTTTTTTITIQENVVPTIQQNVVPTLYLDEEFVIDEEEVGEELRNRFVGLNAEQAAVLYNELEEEGVLTENQSNWCFNRAIELQVEEDELENETPQFEEIPEEDEPQNEIPQ
jgi:hypothetical protein